MKMGVERLSHPTYRSQQAKPDGGVEYNRYSECFSLAIIHVLSLATSGLIDDQLTYSLISILVSYR